MKYIESMMKAREMTPKSEKKTPGRPKDDGIDRQIILATWALLEGQPLAQLTVNEIAKAAGTSRPAIYRRWRSVEEIVIDAFLSAVEDRVPSPGTIRPADALREYIRSLAHFLNGRVGRVVSEILGRAQNDDALMRAFHDGFLIRRRAHGRALIERGQAEGVFRADFDCDLIIDLYAGPIYFRAFTHHAPLDDAFTASLADAVLAAIQTRSDSDAET